MYNKKQVLSRRSVREKGVEGRQLLLSFFSADGRATAVEAVMHSLSLVIHSARDRYLHSKCLAHSRFTPRETSRT